MVHVSRAIALGGRMECLEFALPCTGHLDLSCGGEAQSLLAPSSYLSPEPVDQTTGPLFNRRHGIENHVLAEASPDELHARGQIFDEIGRDDASGQTEVVDAVAVDRCVEEILGLLQ